jgi:hypothetical protein
MPEVSRINRSQGHRAKSEETQRSELQVLQLRKGRITPMKALSGKERLLRVFRQQETDRMPFWLWGVDPMFRSGRPSWKPLYDLVEKYELDIMRWWRPKPRADAKPAPGPERRQSDKPDMWEYEWTTKTPKGDLTRIHYQPKDGSPGYIKKHLIESIEDAEKWLSIPHRLAKPNV